MEIPIEHWLENYEFIGRNPDGSEVYKHKLTASYYRLIIVSMHRDTVLMREVEPGEIGVISWRDL